MSRRIVCIIGSSKFKDQQLGHAQAETLNGNIVLVTGFWHHVDKYPITDEKKASIDRLTLDKIDMATEVLVVNPHGYVGESTKKQIQHARDRLVPVRYTNEEKG